MTPSWTACNALPSLLLVFALTSLQCSGFTPTVKNVPAVRNMMVSNTDRLVQPTYARLQMSTTKESEEELATPSDETMAAKGDEPKEAESISLEDAEENQDDDGEEETEEAEETANTDEVNAIEDGDDDKDDEMEEDEADEQDDTIVQGDLTAGEASSDEEETLKAVENHSTSGEFQDLLLSRRTINEFETSLPEGWEDSLERAIVAATYAPNHRRTEPWRFHLLGQKAIRKVCELNAELVSAKKGPEAGKKKLNRWLDMPGWLVVTCVQSSDESMDNPSGLAREDYAACCCAVQNLCLSLHADGIGTKWTTGPVNFDSRFGPAVGLPSDEYVVGTMWFGTPGNVPSPPVKKLSVADVLTKHA